MTTLKRSLVAGTFAVFACACVSSALVEGETCGGYTATPGAPCGAGLVCCQPESRIADMAGKCMQEATLAKKGAACGPSVGLCCATGLCVFPDGGNTGICP